MTSWMASERKRACLAALALALTLSIVLTACGKKGPPLPPLTDGNTIARPEQLAYTRDGSQVILTWTHRTDPETAGIPPDAFEVSLATVDAAGCEGCPFIFRTVGTVAMPEQSFRYDLAPGVRHYFRIRALGQDDLKSGYSETLYIDLE